MTNSQATAIDVTPETAEKYDAEMNYLGFHTPDSREAVFGHFLVVTTRGLSILSPQDFYRTWKFSRTGYVSRVDFMPIDLL